MGFRPGGQTTVDGIFLAAMELFQKNGYTNTHIRQIADRANVSLGLVNHYFGSKRDLGYAVLETLVQYVVGNAETYMGPPQNNMLLFDATETRAVNSFLIHGSFHQFYIDTLAEDIFFSYLEHRPVFLLEQLQETYHYSINKDMALLYSRYIPYMVEKTLVLKKQSGMFPSISDDEIPFQIFSSTYAGRIPQRILEDYDRESRILAPKIVELLSPIPDREELNRLGLLPLRLSTKK